MPAPSSAPDDFFLAEFGSSDLASRLWRGGLRAKPTGYTVQSATRDLVDALKDGLDARVTDGSVEALINEVETCWNDPARMRRACQVIADGERRKSSALSASLAKVFLSIDLFQPAMVTCLVNKISEFGEESSSEPDIAMLLLNQLRWLDFIVDGTAMCESLLSIVPVVSARIQRTLIEALPEIIDDASREPAVAELIRLLEDSPSLMGSIVDSLSSLGVDEARLIDVNSSILSTLAAANRDMLPASLRYLLNTCPQSLLTPTITALRHTLALPGLGAGPGRICLDAVRAGLRMRKIVADHAIKVLRAIEKPSDHRPADFWIFIALFDSPMHRKSAEIVFRKKTAKKAFSRALLDAALAPFAEAFGSLTNRIIEMASLCAKSAEFGTRRAGVTLYALLFRLFPSGNTRRNVIVALLDHTGTRRPQEMDCALEGLALIARESEYDRSLLPHSASIQGLLDFLECFSDSQLRQIWTVLAYLCRASSGQCKKEKAEPSLQTNDNKENENTGNGQSHQDEDRGEAELAMLEILLRKELTHSDPFYRKIGVVGACTMVKVLGNVVNNNILTMLLDVGRSHPYSQALAFDELSQVFCGKLGDAKETAESIRKTISTLFEKKYITVRTGLGTLVKDEELLPAKLFGNLEGEEVEFCCSISTLVRDERTLKESQDAVRTMAPNLRLLCVMTANRYSGSLSEIDALIGAPLHIPLLPTETEVGGLASHAKGDLLLSLFIAHCWVVELINGFAEQESTEIRGKCLKRVDDLLSLTAQISTCVKQIPLWKEVIFDAYNGSRGCQAEEGAAARKFSKASRGKRTARGSAAGPIVSSQKGTEWQIFSRQLSPSALSLIRITNPVTWRYTETESEFVREGEPTTETVSLSIKGLVYLLSELAVHVDGLVAVELKSSTVFSVTLFRTTSASSSTIRGFSGMSQGTSEARLKNFKSFRNSITSLGKQLCLCMKKILPEDDDEVMEEGSSLEMYQTSIQLCLQSLAVALNSRILGDDIAEEFLFTILGSIRLDESPFLEASNPFTSADVHVAAKESFIQLRKTLQEIMGKSDDNADMRAGCAAKVGFLTCCAFLAAMDSVFLHCSEKDEISLSKQFSQCAYSLLEHRWDTPTLRSRKILKLIPGVVRIYVQHSSNSFKTVEILREQVVKLSEKQEALKTRAIGTQDANGTADSFEGILGSMTEQTCNAYAVSILEQYLSLFKSFQPQKFEDTVEAFQKMQSFIKAELPLYTLARQNQRLLGPVMRAGRSFVDVFLRSCLPFLKEQFKDHRGSVIQICKMHQKPTRLLQTFCAHSKFTRDSSLTGLVPPLRKSLELLLYRVKDLLHAHNATDAFQLGNLKHRDINGEVLSSQHLQYKSDSEEESQYGTIPPSDDDVDERGSRATGRSHGKLKKGERKPGKAVLGSGKMKKGKKTKAGAPKTKKRKPKAKPSEGSIRSTPRPDLDFTSDAEKDLSEVEEPERTAGMHNEAEEEDDHISAAQQVRIPNKKRARQKNKIQIRNPLIDDEAAGSDDGEDEQDVDLSQFLVFGDEEES